MVMCGFALFIFLAQNVLMEVDCMQDNPRRMAWGYYDETDYNKLTALNIAHQTQQKPYLNNEHKAALCCDYEEITTDVVSAEEDDVMATITELRSTSTQVFECPKGKSLFSIEDLQKIILYVVNTTNIECEIDDFSHAIAETMIETYTTKLNNYIEWYTERPTHLKHILQHIDEILNDIQEKVDKLSLAMSDVKKQEENYNLLDNLFKFVKDQFNKSKQLCTICQESETLESLKPSQRLSQSLPYEDKEYYCDNVDTVYNRIIDSMAEFEVSTIDAINLQIQEYDLHFAYKITEFSNKLKNITMEEFDTNMYDIISLLDDYLQYNEIIEEISNANSDDLQNQLLAIETELPHLKTNIHTLREICVKKCQLKPEHVFVKKLLSSTAERLPFINPDVENSSRPLTFSQQDHQNILDELLKEIQTDISDKVRHNYSNLFEDLNEKLNNDDTELVNNYLLNLEEIKLEIHDLAENTVEKFKKLKIATPENEMEIVKSLTQNCKALQEDVQNMKVELNEILIKIDEKI